MQLKFEIIGAKGLENALMQLPKALAKSALKQILTKAAKPVLETAEANVHEVSGDLKESLTISPTLSKRQRQFENKKFVNIYVGASWPKGAHAHLEEFGTRYSAAHPFLRPAWDSHKNNLLREIGADMWKILAKKARTLAKKAEKGTLGARTLRELR